MEDRLDDLKNEEDFYRFKAYSLDTERARLFIQFISQILRGFLLNRFQNWKNRPEKIHSLTEMLWIMSSLRKIDISGHQPFFEEPTETQKAIIQEFNISMPDEKKALESKEADSKNKPASENIT